MALFARYLIEAGLADPVDPPPDALAQPHSLTVDDMLWLLDALQGQLALLRALLERAGRAEDDGHPAGNPWFEVRHLREIMLRRQEDGQRTD